MFPTWINVDAPCSGARAHGTPVALEHGAALVEINLAETHLTPHTDQSIRGKASDVLVTLVSELITWKQHNEPSSYTRRTPGPTGPPL